MDVENSSVSQNSQINLPFSLSLCPLSVLYFLRKKLTLPQFHWEKHHPVSLLSRISSCFSFPPSLIEAGTTGQDSLIPGPTGMQGKDQTQVFPKPRFYSCDPHPRLSLATLSHPIFIWGPSSFVSSPVAGPCQAQGGVGVGVGWSSSPTLQASRLAASPRGRQWGCEQKRAGAKGGWLSLGQSMP